MSTHQYRDQLSIDTPEQVALSFPVAGLGSRMLAHLADLLLQSAVYVFLVIVISLAFASAGGVERLNRVSDRTGMWLTAGLIFVNFLFFWGYYTLFEAFWNGQTPGKRLNRIRVIKDTGRQITLFEAMARNFLRIIDMMPTAYVIGIITIVVSKQNKRLGDLLAGTIVVRQEETAGAGSAYSSRSITIAPEPAPVQNHVMRPDQDVEFDPSVITKLSTEDLVMIEAFFARIPDLDPDTIDRIGSQMLASLCRKMQIEVPASPGSRRCLEAIAHSLREVAVYRRG
jgi:uncharacterized RDD family membrane protein YckC